MRVSAFFSLALLGIATALPSQQDRLDAAPITNGFKAVSGALEAFVKDLQGVTESSAVADTTKKLVSGSDKILASMKDATAKIQAMQPVTNILEALPIATAATNLVSKSKEVINALTSKKAIIAKAGQTQETVKQLTAQKAAAQAFGDAITAKLPSAVQSISKSQAQQAVDVIQSGITAFTAKRKA
jgi:hypothetical protein